MYDTITGFGSEFDGGGPPRGEPRAIGEVLAELLSQYEARFPQAKITVVEVPAATPSDLFAGLRPFPYPDHFAAT